MNIQRAVFLDLDTVDRDDLSLTALQQACPIWSWHRITDAPDTLTRIADAQVAVSNKVVLDVATLAAARDLRLVCIAATGTNNVDLEAAKRLGIAVSNVTAYATPAVVQHVFALILALTTKLMDYTEAVARGEWSTSPHFCLLDFPIRELAGRRLGIIGYGELGQAVGRLGEALGMELLISQRPGATPGAGRLPLEQVLAESDVLSLHCPLVDNTRHLIGEAQLARMKPDALLINTARGGIVDEVALAQALRQGVIGGAGIDVLSVEPPKADSALLADDIPNLIVTPHIAWASREARQRLIDEVARNIAAYSKGELRNRVV